MQPCLHVMLDIIMWFELLGTKIFFHVGEEMEVRRCQIWAVGRVLKNFPAPSFQKIHCHMSWMRSGIVIQQQHPLAWHLRPLALNSSLKFFDSDLISSKIDCFIRRSKVQQKHTMHVPKHSRHQFPRAGSCLEFFDGGRPWMLPCHGLRFCVRTVLVHSSFIPSNDLLQEILTMIIKAEDMSEGCYHTVFLVVLCRGTHLLYTFPYPKHSWTMSQIVLCERLNCSSSSLTFKGRMLYISNAACTPQWPNVGYI